MRMPSVAVQRPSAWVAGLLRQPTSASSRDAERPGLFGPQLRRVTLVWVCVSLPVVVVVGTLATTPDRYLVLFSFVASGLYTSPALVHTWLAARRAPHPDNWGWWMWLVALVLMYGIGCAMGVGAVVDLRTSTAVNAAVVAVTALLLMTAIVLMVRSRSGRRAVSVDLVESAMSVIVVAAPAALLWGDDIVHADDSWYAVPAAVATLAMVFGLYWAALLFVRLRDERPASRAIGRIGVALAAVGLVNAVGQTMQGMSGFSLPSAPLLGLHGLCMSLLLFIPLYVPDTISRGLDRLAPKDQVRGAWLPAALMLVGLPALVVTTVVLRNRHEWAPLYSLGVTVVLLVLAALRQLAAVHETRRLYRQVEQEAATRRELLAQVMQRADDDRHRVAAQLHEQAVSAYAAFVSFIQTSALVPSGVGGPVAGASALVRDELRGQAESLRQLMLAVQPLEVDRHHSQSLCAPIHAYVDGLYGDGRAPSRAVTVADDVVLDWSTETIVLRIVQEAVRNVWRHSDASRVDVAIRADGPVVEVVVADDGVGFDPSAVLFESGISAMRGFAALGQGTLTVDSEMGRGTTVTARLGEHEVPPEAPGAAADDEPGSRPRLRLLLGESASVGEA
jgi:signal transduction histidine kinase